MNYYKIIKLVILLVPSSISAESISTDFKTLAQKRLNYPHTFVDENSNLDISLLILETQIIGQNQDIYFSAIRDFNASIDHSCSSSLRPMVGDDLEAVGDTEWSRG